MNAIIPKISEKTYLLSQTRNTYAFSVPHTMNKLEVAKAVKTQYEVDAVSVRIVNAKGKAVRFVRKGGKVNTGVRANVKKAYVRLAEGQSLPVFAALTDEEQQVDGKGPKRSAK